MKKQNFKSFMIVLVSLLIATDLFAQSSIIIRGKVTSTVENEPLAGVTISEWDTNNRILSATATDFDGNYTMKIKGGIGSKITFTYMGFIPTTRNVSSTPVINVVMSESMQTLQEVSVVGRKQVSTGVVNIAERDMTFAMSTINAKDLEDLNVASIDEALQGRMSGVDIVANSGEPGSGMSIRIRGTTSINNGSDPLIVVDGIPFDTNIGSDFDFATADEENYAQLLNISPADIQEISVLKDAAACAMYGNKGANGVLLIKTKRGTISKPSVGYTFKGSLNTPAVPINTLTGSEYTTLILEQAANAGSPLSTATYPQFMYDPNNPFYYFNYGQNTDWYDALTQDGYTQDHSASLSGGGEKASYRASFGYYDQTGTVIGQAYSRLTSQINLDYKVSDNLKFQVSLSYTHGDQDKNYATDLLNTAYIKMPNQSIMQWNSNGEITPNYYSPISTPQGNFLSYDYGKATGGVYNPVAMANSGFWNNRSERILPKFNIQYWAIPNILKYQADLAFDINAAKDSRFLPQIATGRLWPEVNVNRSTDISSESFVVQTFNKLIYTPNLGKNHSLMGMIQLSTYDARSSSFSEISSLSASIFLQDPSISALTYGTNLGLNSGSSQSRSVSTLGMVHYSLLDRYIFNVTVRRDGDSKYSAEHRFGYFPSTSFRWRVSGESFMSDVKIINDLSLRASTGISGNPVNKNYLFYSNYGTYGWDYLGEQGVYSKGPQLSNLRWEKVSDYNYGANLIMFNNRINADFNLYTRRTNDLYFSSVNIPSTSGFSSIGMNVGVMENRGFEFSLNTMPVKTDDLQIDFNMNLARSENEVLSLSDNIPTISTPTASNGTYYTAIKEGNPLGSFYGYRYKGVYLNDEQTIAKDKKGNPIYTYDAYGNRENVRMKFWYPSIGYEFQAGDARYEDINNDGNINAQDIVYLGDVNPLLTGGFGPTVRWKKSLTISAYFYFRYGSEVINQTRMEMEKMYNFNNQSSAVLRRWRHPYIDETSAPDDLLPRALMGRGYNWLGSDRYVEDGSFLRFKSITLSYNFDKQLVKSIGLSDLKLWATVQNVFLWTNYTGMDPEVTLRSGINDLGKDVSRSGRPREYSLGINVAF